MRPQNRTLRMPDTKASRPRRRRECSKEPLRLGATWMRGKLWSMANLRGPVQFLPACLFLTYALLSRQPLYVAWILAT